jgi:hypothetical protein
MISNTVAAVAIAGLWAGIFIAAIMSGLWGEVGIRSTARGPSAALRVRFGSVGLSSRKQRRTA